MKRIAPAAALVLAAMTSSLAPVHAAPASGGAYLGGTLGPSEIDLDCRFSTSCDGSDTAFKLFVGFDLPRLPIPRAAFEVSYIDFGQGRANFTSLTRRTVEVSALTFDLAARGQLAANVSVVGRLGLAYTSAKSRGPVVNESDSGLNPHLGAGLEFALNRQFKLVGNFDYTSYDSGYESGSVTMFGVGVQMGF